jgi:Methylase involved in ubiquinone/menaquinone biosynthesis
LKLSSLPKNQIQKKWNKRDHGMAEEMTERKNLLDRIDEIDKISDQEWKAGLAERKLKELEFHDRDRDQSRVEKTISSDTYEKYYGNKKYYLATRRSRQFVKEWITTASKDKVFLDYACGNGGNAIAAAQNGAALSLGFDISGVSVENARNAAGKAGLNESIRFFQADAENTKLPDNSIDNIVCSGMLHHLDLSYVFPELRRILKPGGKVLAVESLDYNPAIKLYRSLTPDMRTEWEKAHILNLSDVKFASRFFDLKEIRYWHVAGYAAGKFPWLFPLLDRLDLILEKIQYVQRMAWIFTFVLEKRRD